MSKFSLWKPRRTIRVGWRVPVKVSARIARHSRKGGTNQEEHPEVVCSCFSGVYQQSTVQYLPWAEVGRVGRMDERAYPCIDGEVTWMGKEGRMKRCVRERTRSARSRKVISKSTWVYVT